MAEDEYVMPKPPKGYYFVAGKYDGLDEGSYDDYRGPGLAMKPRLFIGGKVYRSSIINIHNPKALVLAAKSLISQREADLAAKTALKKVSRKYKGGEKLD